MCTAISMDFSRGARARADPHAHGPGDRSSTGKERVAIARATQRVYAPEGRRKANRRETRPAAITNNDKFPGPSSGNIKTLSHSVLRP